MTTKTDHLTDHLTALIARNTELSTDHTARPIAPEHATIIVSCVDARTDPAHLYGLAPGDALVFRNAGGRITSDIEAELAMLTTMIRATGGPTPQVLLVHHTDCGMSRLADERVRSMVATAARVEAADVERRAITDPGDSVESDLERLRRSPYDLSGVAVTAAVHNVETGRTTTLRSEVLS